jgi:hypothetical protein
VLPVNDTGPVTVTVSTVTPPRLPDSVTGAADVLGAGPCQTPSIFCSEKPTGVAAPSATPISVSGPS